MQTKADGPSATSQARSRDSWYTHYTGPDDVEKLSCHNPAS